MIGSRTPRNIKYKSDIHERMIFVSNKYSHLLSPLKVGTRVVKNRMTAANYKKHFIQGPEEYPTENVITHFVNKARNGAAIVCFPASSSPPASLATTICPLITSPTTSTSTMYVRWPTASIFITPYALRR